MTRSLIQAITIITATTVSPSSSSDSGGGRLLLETADDVGAGHTLVVQNLRRAWSSLHRAPRTLEDFLAGAYYETVETLCRHPDGVGEDADCVDRVGRRAARPFASSSSSERLDPVVRAALDELYAVRTSPRDAADAVSRMSDAAERLRRDGRVTNEDHRLVGLAAHAVGMESAKQWAEVFTDPTDPLMVAVGRVFRDGARERRLQFDEILGLFDLENIDTNQLISVFTKTLQSDVVGAIDGALTGLLHPTDGNKTAITYALEQSVNDSINSFLLNIVESLCSATAGAVDNALCEDGGLISQLLGLIGGGGGGGNSTDPGNNGIVCSNLPNLPFCQNLGNDGDGDGVEACPTPSSDYCPFPSLECCGLNFNDQGQLNDGGNGGDGGGTGGFLCDLAPNNPLCQTDGLCAITPSLPQCQGGDGGDGDGGDGGVALCALFPNLDQCTGGDGDGDGDGGDGNGGTDGGDGGTDGGDGGTDGGDAIDAICDLFPNNPLCTQATTAPVATPTTDGSNGTDNGGDGDGGDGDGDTTGGDGDGDGGTDGGDGGTDGGDGGTDGGDGDSGGDGGSIGDTICNLFPNNPICP